MTLNVSQLLTALPEDSESADEFPGTHEVRTLAESMRPIPIGRFRRLTTLGTLQAKIGAAYLFHWLRGWFRDAPSRERDLAEVHWRTALRLLDSMSYMRGAVMKIGQTLANFPDIAPAEFVATLNKLHFSAPPMHWSLLKEMVHNELGDDPENLFAEFDKRAFAAASLGQVHRARLKTGEEVAVKIQYPGIARAIQADFRNLFLFLLPGRLTRDWDNSKAQCEELCRCLEVETNYEEEARLLQKAHRLFAPNESILTPGVYTEFCSPRIITMDYLPGRHINQFLESGPSLEERNDVARKILRGWYRLLYRGRLLSADLHPGNFLVLDDGRLGMIDFGFVMELDDEEWERYREIDRPLTTGLREDREPILGLWSDVDVADRDRMDLIDQYAEWCWRSRSCDGEFDFGDEKQFRRGFELFMELVRKRYTRGRANSPVIARCQFGVAAIFYQLQAKINIREIAEEEVQATGWDRSEYAPV